MSQSGFPRLSFLRAALTVVVVVDLLSFFFFLDDARAAALANGSALTAWSDLLSRMPVVGVVVVIGIAAAIAFGRRPGRLWEGLLPLAALTLLSTVHAQLFGSPWRHLYYSGLCLLGWLLGLAVSRRRGMPADESYARIGSIALLGAAYFNAGISKLVFGGVDWISGVPIRAVIVAQDGLVADGVASIYRSWVVTTPAVASLFSVATFGFELAGPLMLVGRRTRLCVALGLLAMHANIFVLTHILYWESMVFLLVFGLSSPGSSAETVPSAAVPIHSRDRTFAASAALLALCAFFAITHQARRYAHLQERHAQSRGTRAAAGEPSAPSASSAPVPASRRQVGPFAVGQTLAPGWSVDALTISDGGFVAALSGRPGRAAFEVTCASSEHRSPFDLGAAHIFYSSDVEFRDLEAVGWAFQAQLRKAADGQDLCDRLVSWRTSAQAGPPR
jgi:hypothetical protein